MSHPSDLELADYVDAELDEATSEEVERHLDSCELCARLVAQAGTPLPFDEGAAAPIDEESAAALAVAFGDEPGPVEAGSLWRLEWDGAAEAVLVITVEADKVEIVPVVFDPLVGDEGTRLLEAGESPVRAAGAVWTGLRRRVPLGAFAQYLGACGEDVMERLFAGGQSLGGPMRSSAEPAARVRARLILHLERLDGARWTPPQAAARPTTVSSRLEQLGMAPTELAKRLGMIPADVTAVLRGRRAFTDSEARAAAGLLGLDPTAIAQPPPVPAGLVIELQKPRWRSALARRGSRLGSTEHEVRARVAAAVMPMAARTTGPRRSEPDWAQLVADQLRSS